MLYSEKRVTVMENILLDLKTASESWFAPSDEQPQPQQQQFEQYDSTQQLSSIDSDIVVVDTLPEVVEQPLQQQISSSSSSVTSSSGPKVSVNYESMNIKELQAEARNRNISGVSSLRRKELIEQLRKLDESVSGAVSTSIVLDPFLENAAPLDSSE
jgi:hypothetical protein